jgi:hypothetical protein
MACSLGRFHPLGPNNVLPPGRCHPGNYADGREALQAAPAKAGAAASDLFRVRKEPVHRDSLAPSISSSKWEDRGVRDRPVVPAVVHWSMPQACPK